MKDSLVTKFINNRPAEGNVVSMTEADELVDLGAFGFLRGTHERATMLELRYRDGSISAYGYAWLNEARFDPSEGITMHIAGRTVTITGRNLNAEIRPNVRLFAAILRHRISWIQEADGMKALDSKPLATVVERIVVK